MSATITSTTAAATTVAATAIEDTNDVDVKKLDTEPPKPVSAPFNPILGFFDRKSKQVFESLMTPLPSRVYFSDVNMY